jgi:Putative transposase
MQLHRALVDAQIPCNLLIKSSLHNMKRSSSSRSVSDEFIRRFLMDVMPNGFHRIRYYGFLGNRYRNEKLAECGRLLGMRAAEHHAETPKPKREYQERYEELTGRSLRQCPHCQQGQMVKVAVLPRAVVMPPRGINSS